MRIAQNTTQAKTDIELAWDDYFSSSKTGEILKTFDALANIGMRPVPIGECPASGKIKIPMGIGWGKAPINERRERLARCIAEGVPVGVGCQPDGHVVLDIDPPGKDRGKLPTAWKEAASILFGGEDWPDTLIISTQAGCHVWFKISEELSQAWTNRGKLELPLPSGGKVEFFTGNEKQSQVACTQVLERRWPNRLIQPICRHPLKRPFWISSTRRNLITPSHWLKNEPKKPRPTMSNGLTIDC